MSQTCQSFANGSILLFHTPLSGKDSTENAIQFSLEILCSFHAPSLLFLTPLSLGNIFKDSEEVNKIKIIYQQTIIFTWNALGPLCPPFLLCFSILLGQVGLLAFMYHKCCRTCHLENQNGPFYLHQQDIYLKIFYLLIFMHTGCHYFICQN